MSDLQFRYPYFNRGSIRISPNDPAISLSARNTTIRLNLSENHEMRVSTLTSALSAVNETATPTIEGDDNQSPAEDTDNSADPTTVEACSADTATTADHTALNTATEQLNSLTLRSSAFQLTSDRDFVPKTSPLLPRYTRSAPIDIAPRRYLSVPPDALPMPNFDNPRPRNNVRRYLPVPPHALPLPNFPPRRN